MAKLLGKLITAGGGGLVAVFSLVGWIVILASDDFKSSAANGLKAHAIIQGILLMLLGGALIAGALVCYAKAAKALAGLAVAIAILASSLAGVATSPRRDELLHHSGRDGQYRWRLLGLLLQG